MTVRKLFCLLLVMGATHSAFGECTKDTDCKGDRICHEGTCMSPEEAKTPVAAPTTSEPPPVLTVSNPPTLTTAPPQGGKAHLLASTRSGTTVAYVGGASTVLFGSLSAATTGESPGLSLGAGSLALLSTAIATPIAASSANRARQYMRAHGSFVPSSGYAIAGWTTYTLAVLNGAGLVAVGAGEGEVPAGLIISCTLLGLSSTLFMAADTMSVRVTIMQMTETSDFEEKSFRVAVTPVFGRDVQKLALVGSF